MAKKKDIRALTKEQLREFFIENNDQAFRGNQIYLGVTRSTNGFGKNLHIPLMI
jgi:hypothetical protein